MIAITGLGCHAFDSWRSRISTECPLDRPMWLRDFLPERFPHARIMTYGYGSSLRRSNGANITDCRRSFIRSLLNSRRRCTVCVRLAGLPSNMLTISLCLQKRPIAFIGHCFGGILVAQVGGNIPSPTAALLCSTKGYGSRP